MSSFIGAPKTLLKFTNKPINTNTFYFALCGLSLANLYPIMSWKLDSPGSIIFTIHLHKMLVLIVSGSTSHMSHFSSLYNNLFNLL